MEGGRTKVSVTLGSHPRRIPIGAQMGQRGSNPLVALQLRLLKEQESKVYKNLSVLPDKIIRAALLLTSDQLKKETPIHIEWKLPLELVIRNKKRGKTHGRFGWYWPSIQKVEVLMPVDVRYPFILKGKYTTHRVAINDPIEYLLAILAHEMRHHWQHITIPKGDWRLVNDRIGKMYREIDAESFEFKLLNTLKEVHSVATV